MRRISLGFACNNACVFCAQGRLREREPTRDVDAELAEISPGETVAFTGGEPTLQERLPSLLERAAARRAAKIVVQTNGRRLAYKKYCELLSNAAKPALLYLDVSLHGSTKEMHEYHTSQEGSFAQTIRGLDNARAVGLPTGVTVVVTRSNLRHLREMVQVCHRLGVRAVRFQIAERFGRALSAPPAVVPALGLVSPRIDLATEDARRLGFSEDFPFAGIGDVEADR